MNTNIKFNKNGKLRIMHITDTHIQDGNAPATLWLIEKACEREMPDIAVITGDNVHNYDDAEKTKAYIDKLMGIFTRLGIPAAVTFGNHDSEVGAMSREELMLYYSSFPCHVENDRGEKPFNWGTYNVPVMSSDEKTVKYNLWVFDSGDYDGNGHYGCMSREDVEWYKNKSDELTRANGGKPLYSLGFQHMIVPEVYDVLTRCSKRRLYSFEHIINKGEYYMFSPREVNFGTLNETPCSGGANYGQFDAMVEKGDVLAMFTGHDHTNAFGVKYKGIDIMNSLSTRYNGDSFSTSYGYRIIEVDENDTSVYTTKAVHWYDFFDIGYAVEEKKNGDDYGFKTALDIAFKGFWQKLADTVSRVFATLVTGRQVTYED